MGILNKLTTVLKGKTTDLAQWNVLTDEQQLQSVMVASEERPQLLYKHSHTCGICFMAKKEIDSTFEALEEQADMNFVNVIKARGVSNAIAQQTGIRHESPQVLLIDDRDVIWHASHHSIKGSAILEALENKEPTET